jgi:hypothetical protein
MSFRPIRERDSRGTVLAAGYQWTELKDTPGLPLFLLTCAGVVGVLFGLWVAVVGDIVAGLPLVLAGAGLAWWSWRARARYGHQRRALIFRADGSVSTLTEILPLTVQDILSLDYRLEFDTPYIELKTTNGRKIDVVGNRGLEDDEARAVHIQLTQALHEVRQAMMVQ